MTHLYLLPHNAPRVLDALIAAFPAVAPADIRVESDGQRTLKITMPDAIAAAAIDAVVQATSPANDPPTVDPVAVLQAKVDGLLTLVNDLRTKAGAPVVAETELAALPAMLPGKGA